MPTCIWYQVSSNTLFDKNTYQYIGTEGVNRFTTVCVHCGKHEHGILQNTKISAQDMVGEMNCAGNIGCKKNT